MKLSEKLSLSEQLEDRGYDRLADEARALEERIEAYECLQRSTEKANRKALDAANARAETAEAKLAQYEAKYGPL